MSTRKNKRVTRRPPRSAIPRAIHPKSVSIRLPFRMLKTFSFTTIDTLATSISISATNALFDSNSRVYYAARQFCFFRVVSLKGSVQPYAVPELSPTMSISLGFQPYDAALTPSSVGYANLAQMQSSIIMSGKSTVHQFFRVSRNALLSTPEVRYDVNASGVSTNNQGWLIMARNISGNVAVSVLFDGVVELSEWAVNGSTLL